MKRQKYNWAATIKKALEGRMVSRVDVHPNGSFTIHFDIGMGAAEDLAAVHLSVPNRGLAYLSGTLRGIANE